MVELCGRKLTFGDKEQINTLKEISEGGEHTYEVTVDFDGSYTTVINAKDEEEAKEIAKEELDINDADIEIDRIQVEEIFKNESGN
jgi:hypothetical protein